MRPCLQYEKEDGPMATNLIDLIQSPRLLLGPAPKSDQTAISNRKASGLFAGKWLRAPDLSGRRSCHIPRQNRASRGDPSSGRQYPLTGTLDTGPLPYKSRWGIEPVLRSSKRSLSDVSCTGSTRLGRSRIGFDPRSVVCLHCLRFGAFRCASVRSARRGAET